MRSAVSILTINILLITSAAYAQGPEPVAYKAYLQQVIEHYPSLKKENANIEKAVSQRAIAAAGRVPQLWASAKFEYGDDPVYVFGSLLRQNRFTSDDFALGRLNTPGPRSDNSVALEGQWLLFDFAQTSSRIKSAGLFAESARYQAELTKMEAILAASEIYSRLALSQELLTVLEDVTHQASQDIHAAESLNKMGKMLGADFYMARMLRTKLMQNRNELRAQHAALMMAFNILRGEDPALPVAVKMDLKEPARIGGSAEEWIAKSLEQRLDIQAMGKMLEAQGVEVNREKKSFLPKVRAYGQADKHAHSLNDSGGNNYVVGVKATMDIADLGFGARVRSAQAESDRLAYQYQELKDQGAKEIAETYYRVQALKDNVRLAAQARDDSKEAARLMAPLYKEGKRSIDQMLSIRAGSAEAYEHWLRLENASRQNILKLKFYAGELDAEQAEEIYGQ